METVKLTEQIICERLHQRYHDARYKLSNAFIFRHNWESDFFIQNRGGYCYEFEVKISRSDFFNDKKKTDKHSILSTGKYQTKGTLSTYNRTLNLWEQEEKVSEYEHEMRPNKFFYVVPEGLITADELPPYAGLIYCPKDHWQSVVTIKEAPFIHKEKLNVEKVLCSKFYHYWMNEKNEAYRLKQRIKELEFRLNKEQEVQVSDTTKAA